MYEQLIPAVIRTFAYPGESKQAFMQRVHTADCRLRTAYATSGPVSSELYSEPIIRAAYLWRHLGHTTLQIGDLLRDLEGTPAEAVLAAPDLKLAALCGGPCPEAIALATLHQQAGGRQLEVMVLDRHADAWHDCWPITARIIRAYPDHPNVSIGGLAIDLLSPGLNRQERKELERTQVFTCMNCLNELIGIGGERLRRGMAIRLDALPPGTLVLASDLAGYSACERGLLMLRELLEERGAELLLCEIDPQNPHHVENRFAQPREIAWIYRPATNNNFRINVKQLRMAALMA